MGWFDDNADPGDPNVDPNAPPPAAPPPASGGMSPDQRAYQEQALRNAYWKYLYRVPDAQELATYATKPEAEFQAHLESIPNSWESRRVVQQNGGKTNEAPYPTGGSGGGAGGGGNGAKPGSLEWVMAELQKVKSTDDPNYWMRVIAADPKVAAGDQSAIAYWVDRIRRGDGSELVKNGTLTKFADGNGAGDGYGFGAGTKPYKDFTVPDFTADPGYQFTLGEGLKAISARKAAQGGLLTGGTDKARANYATGLASQTYNDFYNRSANSYQMNQGNYFTGLNSAFDKWYKTTQLGANAAAQ